MISTNNISKASEVYGTQRGRHDGVPLLDLLIQLAKGRCRKKFGQRYIQVVA